MSKLEAACRPRSLSPEARAGGTSCRRSTVVSAGRGAVTALLVGAGLTTLGCYRAAPRTAPLAGALEAVVHASPEQATRLANAALGDEGIESVQFRPDTGLVESAWYDVGLRDLGARELPDAERIVRFRFLIGAAPAAPAAPAGDSSRVFLETVYRPFLNPMGARIGERLVPRDHPAMPLARRLLERVREKAPR